jgi:UDP-N-acetylglucosamine diphosphorylase / glucose-1-phosphate thymidylyltransferase / UDP-N-acetylgalactosamine diphosphorylase / glucosamine-1-phosphate N-acetyltransferase / galactosamine-1-phosphate N-acetyltransferase
MHELSTELFDLNHTLTADLFRQVHYPWEVLPLIAAFLPELAAQLGSAYAEIAPGIWVGEGTHIEKTAFIMGPAIIGRGCQIRHAAFIRDHVILGDGVVIGNSTEVKNAILFDHSQAPHFNYIGDSILGSGAHMGAGAVLSNFKATGDEVNVQLEGKKIGSGLRKFGALLGDRVEVGSNAVLNPGTIVGAHSIIYPLCSVRGTIPSKQILKNDGQLYPMRDHEE